MRYGRRRYPGNGPFRDLPPWQRPGQVYRYGRGYWGQGDPTKCARFPWLPRWWWSNPDYEGMPPVPTQFQQPSQEKEFLENQLSLLEKDLESIKKRLDELSETEKTE